MDILDLYKLILKTVGIEVTHDGCCRVKDGEETIPVTYRKKRLVLPTREHLASPDKEKLYFHPLNASITRGPSEVLDMYREMAFTRINEKLSVIFYAITRIAANPALQVKLSSSELELLASLKEFGEEDLKLLEKVIEQAPINAAQQGLVSCYVRIGAVISGKKYKRGSIISFPLLEEVENNGSLVGTKVKTKKAIKNFKKLYELIGVTAATDGTKYSVGSDSMVSPAAEALFSSIELLCSVINDLIAKCPTILGDLEKFDLSWSEHLSDLDELLPQIRSIPIQPGNEGTPINQVQSQPTAPVVPVAPTPQPQQHVVQQTQVPPAPVPMAPAFGQPAMSNSINAPKAGKSLAQIAEENRQRLAAKNASTGGGQRAPAPQPTMPVAQPFGMPPAAMSFQANPYQLAQAAPVSPYMALAMQEEQKNNPLAVMSNNPFAVQPQANPFAVQPQPQYHQQSMFQQPMQMNNGYGGYNGV